MTVEVHERRDLAQVYDADLQELLKRHIESTTGRKVVGEVEIETKRVAILGRQRFNEYTAICELGDAK